MERDMLEAVLALASDQFSVFSTQQASSLGMTNPMLDAATARGWICVERPGVHALCGAPPSRWRTLYAAALAAGPRAVISYASAAMIHNMYGIVADQPELTVPWGVSKALTGVRVHKSRTLLPEDLQDRHGLQVTNPVRTVIDLAARTNVWLLGAILDEGSISRLWTPETVQARLDRFGRGVPGRAQLARTLSLRLGEGRADSRLEQRVFRVVTTAFPGFTTHYQVVLSGRVFDMDIAWVPEKIDGEVDGLATRASSRTKFEQSSRRENILQAHGWRIVHLTHQMDDETLIAQLAPYFPC